MYWFALELSARREVVGEEPKKDELEQIGLRITEGSKEGDRQRDGNVLN